MILVVHTCIVLMMVIKISIPNSFFSVHMVFKSKCLHTHSENNDITTMS